MRTSIVHDHYEGSGPSSDLEPAGAPYPDASHDLEYRTCGVASQTGSVQAYNEEAFRYFLALECRRAEVSGKPFLLLLVDLEGRVPREQPIDPGPLFTALSSCLRETDFVGWYREGRIAGGVLTQHGTEVATTLTSVLKQRVREALAAAMTTELAYGAHIRIYQVPGQRAAQS
jgi:hypothetical protein